MILFIKIIVILGLIAFPIIKGYFKGVVEFFWLKGFVIGANFDSIYVGAKINDKERIFKTYSFQFHIILITLIMSFSIEKKNIELD